MAKIKTIDRLKTETQLAKQNNVKALRMAQHDLRYHRKGTLATNYQIAKHFGIMRSEMKELHGIPTDKCPNTDVISVNDMQYLFTGFIKVYQKRIWQAKAEQLILKDIKSNLKEALQDSKVTKLIKEAPTSKELVADPSNTLKQKLTDFENSVNMDFRLDFAPSKAIMYYQGMIKLLRHELDVANQYPDKSKAMILESRSMYNVDKRPQSAKEAKDNCGRFEWYDMTFKQALIIKSGMDFEHHNNVDFRPAIDNDLKEAIDKYFD